MIPSDPQAWIDEADREAKEFVEYLTNSTPYFSELDKDARDLMCDLFAAGFAKGAHFFVKQLREGMKE